MRKIKQALLQTERHKKFQMIITLGILATTLVSYLVPHWNDFVILAGLMTNLIWVWE